MKSNYNMPTYKVDSNLMKNTWKFNYIPHKAKDGLPILGWHKYYWIKCVDKVFSRIHNNGLEYHCFDYDPVSMKRFDTYL